MGANIPPFLCDIPVMEMKGEVKVQTEKPMKSDEPSIYGAMRPGRELMRWWRRYEISRVR